MRCSVLSTQSNFTRKATVCQLSFIPICAESEAVGMVDLYDQFGNCREAVDLQLKDEIIAEYVFAILYTYDHRRMPGEKPRKLQ